VTRLMPPKRGNQKPKGKGQPKRKNPAQKEQAYNRMRNEQTQRWRAESRGNERQNQTISTRQPRSQRQEGVAVRVRLPTVGMSDLMQHRITWVMGTVYIGNGTVGAAKSVYFNDNSGANLVAGAGGGFWVPIAPGDAKVGTTYAQSLMKLYRRMRVRQCRVHLLTQQSSTTNNLVVGIAPCRGTPGAAEWPQESSSTTAAQTLVNLMSIAGMKTCDSFQNTTLELTPYIAGGSGARQDEFNCASSATATTFIGSTADGAMAVPCAVQVAGNSTVTALQASSTHIIVGEMVVDFLDFCGAVSVIDPEGLVIPKEVEARRAFLLNQLSSLSRADRESRDRSASPTKGKGELY
jgi:hypothetical protein